MILRIFSALVLVLSWASSATAQTYINLPKVENLTPFEPGELRRFSTARFPELHRALCNDFESGLEIVRNGGPNFLESLFIGSKQIEELESFLSALIDTEKDICKEVQAANETCHPRDPDFDPDNPESAPEPKRGKDICMELVQAILAEVDDDNQLHLACELTLDRNKLKAKLCHCRPKYEPVPRSAPWWRTIPISEEDKVFLNSLY